MKRVVVIGGGLAGLSGAWHLAEHAPLVFEKEIEVGGICRSFEQDGFTFDVTGHLLHLKHEYTKNLIERLLPGAFRPHERKASIWSRGRLTPYPFQANTYGLPADVVRDCLLGFIETLGQESAAARNFEEWILQTFGRGIADHFMLPFNQKFWKRPLNEVTADWVSWSIPKPSLEEVVNGALGIVNEGMGYNPTFAYPERGGIDCLPRALARSVKHLFTSHAVTSIDSRRRRVLFSNGRVEEYDQLLSTLPLPVVFELIDEAPSELRTAARGLQAVSVLDINIGVDRPHVSDRHWLYFPESRYVFTRVGFPMNFSDDAAPAGTSSLYIEITHRPEAAPSLETVYSEAIRQLIDCGILRQEDRVLTRNVIPIPFAYVVFDHHRQRHLQKLISFLEDRDIIVAGRYGDWDYYSMEDTILSGKRAAEKIAARTEAGTLIST
jgi:protoporphyrinogen oxidase